ncbi:DUF4229 domain-containing protein [Kineosporia sp. R_H_3]|uniref:DUF4229 domain-containing protein n=1 Tax=Kineosporia sp. R_H_3 TaxID=1961848 RepID=UPI0013045942|nr:DUF4229 domain-containing protein [Kineosporia sp. R_H_3]
MVPFLKFSVLRLALFLVALVTFSWLGAEMLLAVVLAAVVSALLSYVLLRGPREELAGTIQDRVQRRLEAGGAKPSAGSRRRAEDDAVEDAAADAALARQDEAARREAAREGSAEEGQPGAQQ